MTQVAFSNNVGAAVQAGVDDNFAGHWFANFDVKQIFVNTIRPASMAARSRRTDALYLLAVPAWTSATGFSPGRQAGYDDQVGATS